MWTITFITFILITFLVGYIAKEELTEVLPVTTGGLLLLLYILAMLRDMKFIGPIATVALFIFILSFILMGKKGRANCLKGLGTYYINSRSLVLIAALVIIACLTAGHVATWWDDINYWITDAKALYYLNGFTGKYGNVAPEFGDYPPGIQIMKWCLLKLDPNNFREGLSYSGYYLMNMIFALPLLKKLKDKNIIYQIAGMLVLFLIPGVVNDVWSHGACADITMGIIYGSILISVFDMDDHKGGFYYGRILILLSLLLLTKSVGFEWAVYAVIVLLASLFIYRDKLLDRFGKKYRLYSWICILTAVSFQLSWWIYCLLSRRIAKLTSSGAHMAAGKYSLPDNAVTKATLFAKGFAFCPMHTDRTVMLDLSSLTMLVIVILLIIVLAIRKKTDKKETVLLLLHSCLTGFIAYGIILIGHISIFATESQYDTPEVMAISISRYAAPFTVGMLMLLIYMITDRINKKWAMIACAVFVFLTTDYIAAYNCLWGYRAQVEENLSKRAEVIDDNGYIYASVVKEDKNLWGHRVLYFRDPSEIHWVKDTYINYEVAPVATVYADINPETMTRADIEAEIARHHAEFIYVDNVAYMEKETSGKQLFEGLILDFDGRECPEEFKYCRVYRVR